MGLVRTVISGVCVLTLATGVGLMARGPVAAELKGVQAPRALPGPSEAREPIQPEAPLRPEVAGAAAVVSMDQAVKMAEQRYRARVVRAETERDGPRVVYVLKLLNEAGQVWTVRVDAENGAIL